MKLKLLAVSTILLSGLAGAATSLTVPIYDAQPTGQGDAIGEIIITETQYGLLFSPHLQGLPPGVHGFHVHTNPSCDPAKDKEGNIVPALAAGGHFDPQQTGKHLGPYSDQGHMGDLPGLVVNADGTANYQLLAPRLKHLSDVVNRSLMIHVGGDNYSDHPEVLGGGGMRMACGVVK